MVNIKEALAEIRKDNKRKFDQSVDLLINLRSIDIKRNGVNVVVDVPHPAKKLKVAGFLTKRSKLIESVLEPDFAKYKDSKKLKELEGKYDFFIAVASLMPKVATTFGKVLGPVGKMPSPQLGILVHEDDKAIQGVLDKIAKSVKIRAKEPSIKLSIGKLSMSDEYLEDNIRAIYRAIINALPMKEENLKSVMVKATMSKPIKVEVGKWA